MDLFKPQYIENVITNYLGFSGNMIISFKQPKFEHFLEI